MDCPIWPELDLGELSREQLARLAGRRYPFSGSFELTERCNLRCVHCYISQPSGSTAARAREVSTDQAKGILDQIAGAGCLYLLLTGGEPLLRPDFEEIYLHAKRCGLLLTFYTNGTLLTPRIADFLAEWRPRVIEITLYGATQATYERVTGVPGSYAACLRGIELALSRGLHLNLKTMVLRTNRHELTEMQALASRLGCDFRFDGLLWPRRDGRDGPADQQIPAAEVIALDLDDPGRRLEWQELRGLAGHQVRGDRVYSCGAGRYGFHVDCTGRLSGCMMAREPSFDLLRGSFRVAWDALEGPLRDVRRLDTACRTCDAGLLCDQCPGWSQAVHSDNETPVAFICQLGRLRAEQLRSSHS